MIHYDKEKFDKQFTPADKVEEFLSTLLTKGVYAFVVFVEILTKYPFYNGLVSKLPELNE